MGCDIHLYVEYRSDNTSPWNFWERQLVLCTWCDTNKKFSPNAPCYDCLGTTFACKEVYTDRNYRLFSILAGVRQYYEGLTPISAPKGQPPDCSVRTRQELENADHTFSWFTVAELNAVDWLGKRIFQDSEWNGYREVFRPVELSFAEMAETFYTETLPLLNELAKTHGDENVRIVFGFDN